jgi:hypothetical protein
MKLEFDAGTLALIVVGIALWFMIWVLWNWRREERRKHVRSHADLQEKNIGRTCELVMSRSETSMRGSGRPISYTVNRRGQFSTNLQTR